MYFILSKLFLFLLLPYYWVIILVIVGVLTNNKRSRKRLLITAAVVCYLFSIPLLLNWFENIWDVRAPVNHKKYSCAIVLGGFSGDGGPDGGHFTEFADRFIQGLKLIHSGQVSHILISGGSGMVSPGSFREANYVKTQLQELGIPDSLILTESNSKNTYENAKFSQAILDKSGLQPPYLLVTSGFHMRRSLMLFRHAGLQVDPYPSGSMAFDTNLIFTAFLPDADVLNKWDYYTKEVVGFAVNYFK